MAGPLRRLIDLGADYFLLTAPNEVDVVIAAAAGIASSFFLLENDKFYFNDDSKLPSTINAWL